MKNILLLFLFCSSIAFAQKKTYTHSLQGVEKVQINSDTKITVVSGNASQLEISGVKNEKDDKKLMEKKKGLKAIYSGGEDTTDGFGFSINKEGTVLIINDLKSFYQRGKITITLPKTMNIDINAGNMGAINIDGFSSELELRTNIGKIDLKNVTGPITAHSSTGTISVDFSTINQSSPISISTSVGEIDVSIPGSTKANLNVNSRGTIYTNFDFKAPPKKGLRNVSGLRKVNQQINGGGVNIKLHSSMGNIYLRKK